MSQHDSQPRFCIVVDGARVASTFRKKKVFTDVTLEEIYTHSARTVSGCIDWMLGTDRKGYGRIKRNGKTRYVTHWIMFLTGKRPLGSSDCVLHHCDNPRCINPDHLYRGSNADNVRDRCVRKRTRNQHGGQK